MHTFSFKNTTPALILIALYLFSPFFLSADSSLSLADDNPKFQWKIDDTITADEVDTYVLSPDGKYVAWTVTKWNPKDHKSYKIIYATPLEGTLAGKDIQITREPFNYSSIQWVPNQPGFSTLSVSAITDRKSQEAKPFNLWIIPISGGEPYPVTKLEKGIFQYDWIDADNILFTSEEENDSLLQKQIKIDKDTSELVEDEAHPKIVRLFRLHLPSKKVLRVTLNTKPISRFSLSRDKKYVVYGENQSVRFGQDQKFRPKYYLLNLETKENREILSDLTLQSQGSYYWGADSKGFFFLAEYTTHPTYYYATVSKVFYYDLALQTYKEIDPGWDRGAAQEYYTKLQVTPDGYIIALADGVYNKHARFVREKNGSIWKRYWIEGDTQRNIQSFQISWDGKTVVYKYSTASTPPRFYYAQINGSRMVNPREIMDIKSPLAKKPLAKREIRTWKGAKNETVEGILFYPANYDPTQKYPLILMIHGGPFGADMDFFDENSIYPTHFWCERGVFVLKPNYHGSSNYGLAFAESIANGNYYDLEIPDIEAGVDMLISEGKVDPQKLGIIGHSNGAILGTGLIINSNRYKAASLYAGDVNWTSDFGMCAFGVSFDTYYFGGTPWQIPDVYIKKSPLFQMEKVTTPTLIFHGDKDRQVPYAQGWEFYQALKVIDKTPVRFISFPGEAHVARSLSHQRRKMKEDIAWFERYLFGTYRAKNEALKTGTPLARLKSLLAISHRDGLYGVCSDNGLLPEIVDYKNIKVGRFEVTRTQWAAFEKDYKYEPGTGNYPVTDVTFEKAQAYAQWLSKATGQVYRLPKEEEAAKLYEKPSGNTFDSWAGYDVNPGDYALLLEEVKKHGDKPVLLKPVGSFAPEGDEPIFDLGGNAAEWSVLKDGKGKVVGGAAILPGDSKADPVPPAAYIGFRLIRE